MTDGDDDDLDLLKRWRAGEREAGETLVRRHYREVFERLRRELRGNADMAADLTQNVFMVAAKKRDDIVTDFRRYLHGTARFMLWDHRAKAGPKGDAVGVSQLMAPGSGAYSVLAKEGDARLLVKALQTLPTEAQAYLMWVYADRLTNEQIAQRVGLTVPQVNGRIHRARVKLRHGLKEISEPPQQQALLDKGFRTWLESLRYHVDEAEGSGSDRDYE